MVRGVGMGGVIAGIVVVVIVFLLIVNSWTTIGTGFVGVVTMFGKYKRLMKPGLNFKIPFVEKLHQRVSIQNRAQELQFQAITADQANVYFTAMLLYSVFDQAEST